MYAFYREPADGEKLAVGKRGIITWEQLTRNGDKVGKDEIHIRISGVNGIGLRAQLRPEADERFFIKKSGTADWYILSVSLYTICVYKETVFLYNIFSNYFNNFLGGT
ncbi:MAG: hypothetical protein PHN26_01440 [Eubacteriaceae bacterium]|nr:hypothetical protein [Eubacteriaceae bacterium]